MKGDACKKKCFYNSGGICCYSGRDCEEAQAIANVYGRRRFSELCGVKKATAAIALNIIIAMLFISMTIAAVKGHQATVKIAEQAVAR